MPESAHFQGEPEPFHRCLQPDQWPLHHDLPWRDRLPGWAEGAGGDDGVDDQQERKFHLDLLHHLTLDHYFASVVGGDSLRDEQGNIIRKPDPRALLHIVEALAVSPQRTLMVGDSRHDIEAAKAAGIPSLAVPYGYNHGEPIQQFAPDWLVNSLEQLIA